MILKNNNLINLIDLYPWWIFIGKYYGFPECCIENFCLGNSNIKYQNLVINGFIPCNNCINLDLQDLKKSIFNNRLLPENITSYNDDLNFFHLLEKFYLSYNINPINEILFRGGFDYLFKKYLNKQFNLFITYGDNHIDISKTDKSNLFYLINDIMNENYNSLFKFFNIDSSINYNDLLNDITILKNDIEVLKNYTFN